MHRSLDEKETRKASKQKQSFWADRRDEWKINRYRQTLLDSWRVIKTTEKANEAVSGS